MLDGEEESTSAGADIAASIDWSGRGPVDTTNYCRCGAVFRSHYKFKWIEGKGVGVTKDPCPACGSHLDIFRSSSDPELVTIGGQ